MDILSIAKEVLDKHYGNLLLGILCSLDMMFRCVTWKGIRNTDNYGILLLKYLIKIYMGDNNIPLQFTTSAGNSIQRESQ